MVETEQSNTKKKKKKILFLLLFVILIFCAGCFSFKFFYHRPEVTLSGNVTDSQFAKTMSEDDLMKYLQDKANKDNVHIQVDTSMEFDKGSELGSVVIKNSPKNQYSLRVITYIDEGNKKIYDSGLIAPKEYVTEGKLLTNVSKGSYKTTSKVMYYDSSNKIVGQSNVLGTLTVNS
ncbi:hypothetical protein [Lactococcus petauri]|uniref:hypothetical protein n=1 Tax=Lactococcus petauri TaxID=1940789 RepID=UPI00254B0502|nr:hypothetical protein [Lactococcus petauri]